MVVLGGGARFLLSEIPLYAWHVTVVVAILDIQLMSEIEYRVSSLSAAFERTWQI